MLQNSAKRIIENKIILITGGTGSFGQTITGQLLKYKPKQIIIYSRGEDKQSQMKYNFRNNSKLKFILGDVRDLDQLKFAMRNTDIVLHAAAQKQVPATELNVLEAVKTNVIGAQNVIKAAISNKVRKAIAISTDKAVEPVNAMGMTKAIQEKLFIQASYSYSDSRTIFACVRYGNVVGSTGSVLPLFMSQVRNNKPITITQRGMTRFILTLKQATELVFLALSEAVGGEVFVPNIPAHNIEDLAEALKNINQKKSTKIKEIGIRVGEKIHETLISPSESTRTVKKKYYFVILPELMNKKLTTKYKKGLKKNKLFRFSSDTAHKLNVSQLTKTIKVEVVKKKL